MTFWYLGNQIQEAEPSKTLLYMLYVRLIHDECISSAGLWKKFTEFCQMSFYDTTSTLGFNS